jgi:hypothetical protein
MKKWVLEFGVCVYVCMYRYMYLSVSRQRLKSWVEFIHVNLNCHVYE